MHQFTMKIETWAPYASVSHVNAYRFVLQQMMVRPVSSFKKGEERRTLKHLSMLDEITNAQQDERDRLVRELANSAQEVLPVVLETLATGPKSRWRAAVQVIRAIGYPRNAQTILTLLQQVSDGNSPAWQEAAETLGEMEVLLVAQHLIALLWDRGKAEASWVEALQGMSSMLAHISPEFARFCAPTAAFLLSQEELFQRFPDLDPWYLISILMRVGPEETAYALPALADWVVRLAQSEDDYDKETGQEIRSFIASFSQEAKERYQQVLVRLE